MDNINTYITIYIINSYKKYEFMQKMKENRQSS